MALTRLPCSKRCNWYKCVWSNSSKALTISRSALHSSTTCWDSYSSRCRSSRWANSLRSSSRKQWGTLPNTWGLTLTPRSLNPALCRCHHARGMLTWHRVVRVTQSLSPLCCHQTGSVITSSVRTPQRLRPWVVPTWHNWPRDSQLVMRHLLPTLKPLNLRISRTTLSGVASPAIGSLNLQSCSPFRKWAMRELHLTRVSRAVSKLVARPSRWSIFSKRLWTHKLRWNSRLALLAGLTGRTKNRYCPRYVQLSETSARWSNDLGTLPNLTNLKFILN